MYERFTDRARMAMTRANQEALNLNHEYVGTEHLLLGLMWQSRSKLNGAGLAVLNMGDSPSGVYNAVKLRLGSPPQEQLGAAKLPLTPRTKTVLDHAISCADTYSVETEHLLLGILHEGGGIAFEVLDDLGITLEKTLEVVRGMHAMGEKAAPAPVVPPALSIDDVLAFADRIAAHRQSLTGKTLPHFGQMAYDASKAGDALRVLAGSMALMERAQEDAHPVTVMVGVDLSVVPAGVAPGSFVAYGNTIVRGEAAYSHNMTEERLKAHYEAALTVTAKPDDAPAPRVLAEFSSSCGVDPEEIRRGLAGMWKGTYIVVDDPRAGPGHMACDPAASVLTGDFSVDEGEPWPMPPTNGPPVVPTGDVGANMEAVGMIAVMERECKEAMADPGVRAKIRELMDKCEHGVNSPDPARPVGMADIEIDAHGRPATPLPRGYTLSGPHPDPAISALRAARTAIQELPAGHRARMEEACSRDHSECCWCGFHRSNMEGDATRGIGAKSVSLGMAARSIWELPADIRQSMQLACHASGGPCWCGICTIDPGLEVGNENWKEANK